MDQTETHILVKTWLDYLASQGRSKHTLSAYQRAINHLVHWSQTTYGEPFDPAHLIARDIRDWKSYQQTGEQAAPSTINQRLVGVASFYKWAIINKLIEQNPTVESKSIRLPSRQPKSLSSQELRRLLRAVHHGGSLRDIAILEILAGTGLRVGELLQLQVGDVVLRERSGWVIVREGKQGGYREVPLASEVRTALTAYLADYPGSSREGGMNIPDKTAPLWMGKQGTLTHRSSVMRILNKYAFRAQLDSVSPHTLRHTFATLYLQANPDDLRGLAALLGHSELNTVMIYTEPTREDVVNRVERMKW
jgi:integrase/recombinase XerC